MKNNQNNQNKNKQTNTQKNCGKHRESDKSSGYEKDCR